MSQNNVKVTSGIDRLVVFLFVLGLLTLTLQVVSFGPAQPSHIWCLGAVALMAFVGRLKISPIEILVFFVFAAVLVALTKFEPYSRIKESEQLLKFLLIYPIFYVLGRSFGVHFSTRPLPFAMWVLFAGVAIEFIIQYLKIPFIYKEIGFGQGALHGTFRERNWFATFFFFIGYIYWLKNNDTKNSFWFVVLMLVVTMLSGSKSVLIALGIAFVMRARYPAWVKASVSAIGVVAYVALFGDELSGARLAVRLHEERGLAFLEAMRLLRENPLGYGVGFVEYHFANISLVIRGLGLGVNSVFSSPIDLMLIAGGVGLAFWCVFFGGVGLGAVTLLAPVAAWSLINPMHQSEIVYLFLGVLVSLAQVRRPAVVSRAPVRGALRPPLRARYMGAQGRLAD